MTECDAAKHPLTATSVRPLLLGLGWDRPGGLNRYVRDLHAALAENGVQLRTVVLGPGAEAPHSVVVAGDESASLPQRLWSYARAAHREAADQTIVDVHFVLFSWWPVMIGRLRHHPLIVHFHGPWAEESAVSGRSGALSIRIKSLMERQIYQRATRLIVLSEAFKHLVVDRYGVRAELVEVVPPGVDLDRFTPGRAEARARLGIETEQVVFAARRLVPRMGLDILIQAWAMLPANKGRQLRIAGDGSERSRLQSQIADLGLTESVHLLGRVDEHLLVDHYRAADVCVVPSVALEGFGLVVLEALACGAPTIVTDVGGLPEVVGDLDPSLVVLSGQIDALAERLAAALEGKVPDSDACRTHAEKFTWARAVERTLVVLSAVSAEATRAQAAPRSP